jgi:hypothetical protein
MPNPFISRPKPSEPISRQTLLALLETAFNVSEYRYARQIALGWLAFFPGDLEIKFKYAQALQGLGLERQASNLLEEIIRIDPEYLGALQIRFQLSKNANDLSNWLRTSLFILDEFFPDQLGNDSKAHIYRRCYQWLKNQDRPLAVWEARTLGLPTGQEDNDLLTLSEDNAPDFPLLGVIHLRCLITQGADDHAVGILCQNYLERWPDCLTFKLILAQNEMTSDPANSVALLHEAVAVDTAAQVAERIWGREFPFKKMWPGIMEVAPGHPTSPQSIQVPAPISAALGWNQLPVSPDNAEFTSSPLTDQGNLRVASEINDKKKVFPPTRHHRSLKRAGTYQPYPIIAELKQVAKSMKQPALSRVDGRYPVYVILSTRKGLETVYGCEGANLVTTKMHRLAETIAKYRQWDSLVFLADDPKFGSNHAKIQIEATSPQDPWAIKLALVDLDAELGKRGEMVGAVLIVGGPEIVPFHNLPNPVDDPDRDVPSDNPYATRDENYFIPEWPVGRFPNGCGDNPEKLVRLIENSINYHEAQLKQGIDINKIWKLIQKAIRYIPQKSWQRRKSYGYSAAVWRRASLSVFRPIGDPHHLIVSPPAQVKASCVIHNPTKPCLSLPPGKLAYFNLHGLADTDEWYGQRDPSEPGEDLDFPLALRAADIKTNGYTGASIPEIVFSEACFGAHILGKKTDEAIALKFLSNDTRVVVGSTCVSYGSISTPLIAADLLGHTFWHYLKDGQPAGEALRRARIRLVKEMNQRQGYLDGEDQKTLLSFVLYGDPLVQIRDTLRGPKSTMRSNKIQSPIQTVCDRIESKAQATMVASEMLTQVKEIVEQYLPGMVDAELTFSRERGTCNGHGHACPTSQLASKAASHKHLTKRQVVTLSKTIQANDRFHAQIARMTLDENGKLVKLVVSR